jgi:cysteine sulfinate desulfinase/cysteine desulfurase-like protein
MEKDTIVDAEIAIKGYSEMKLEETKKIGQEFQIPPEIITVVKEHYYVKKRVKKLEEMGYIVEERPMGSGGLLQVRYLKKEIRVQIGFGRGEYNYAMCVIVKRS